MVERDATDIDTTDGKFYDYTTTLAVGSHNYSFVCFDGLAIFATITYNGPTVVPYVAPPVPPGGGVNESKMNKITLQPHETTIFPGNAFTGSLSITEENNVSEYEVFWYVYLLDLNGTEIVHNQGSLAIRTTVVVAYDLDTTNVIPLGTYKILAKTFDRPRDQIAAIQLGMDEIEVTIEPWPEGGLAPFQIPPLRIIYNTLGTIWQLILVLGLLLAFVGFLLFAAHKKKYIAVLVAAVCIMLDLLFMGLIEQNEMTLFGIPLVVFGGFLLTPYRIKAIKNKHFAIALGAALVTLGLLFYLSSFIWF
jgi:hypothetical protein